MFPPPLPDEDPPLYLIIYISPSVEAEEHLQPAVDAREAHEGQREQSGGDHHDGHALHALGHLHQLELLAHAGKHRQRHAEADGRGEGIDHGLQQVVILLDAEDGHAEHGAVRRDQRQEDAQRLIERRRHLLQHDLHHLHQRGDDQDEGDRLQILQAEGVEHVFLYEPGDDRGQRQHEGDGSRHTQRGVNLLRYAKERTDAQELCQHDVVHEDGANENQYILHNIRCFVMTLLRLTAQLVDDRDEEAEGDECTRRQDEEQDVVSLRQQRQSEDAAVAEQFTTDAQQRQAQREAQADADAVEERSHGRLLGCEGLGTSEDDTVHDDQRDEEAQRGVDLRQEGRR